MPHAGWPGLNRFVRLERETLRDGETKRSISYAVTSLTPQQADVDALLKLWRDRWAIENRTFWVRDVTFREDHSRIRSGRAAENLSLLKNAAINYLRTRKVDNIAAALRENAAKTQPLFTTLGIPTF